MNTQHASMPQKQSRVARLSNAELLAQVKRLARNEREATASLVAHLAELDERRLYLAEGFSSLFTYCTQALHLSEHAAYGRIQAARVARRFPVVLKLLATSEIHLTSLRLLAPHLTVENYQGLLAAARHKSKDQVQELVARVCPLADAATFIRKLPSSPRRRPADGPAEASTPALPAPAILVPAIPAALAHEARVSASTDPSPVAVTTTRSAGETTADSDAGVETPYARAVVAPLAPGRYKIQVTVDAATHAKLRRAQDLLRHQIPNGDAAAVIDRALTVLVERLEKQRLAAVTRPRLSGRRAGRRGSRHIPAAVRRAVWARDVGRCAFAGTDGHRCGEESFLEFHHVKPFAVSRDSSVENIELRCRAHNQYEADLYFGVGRERHGRHAGRDGTDPSDGATAPEGSVVREASGAYVVGNRGNDSVRTESRRLGSAFGSECSRAPALRR